MDATWDVPPTQRTFSWHTTKTTQEWSELKASTWPPSSPDLTPITHPSGVQKQILTMDAPHRIWLDSNTPRPSCQTPRDTSSEQCLEWPEPSVIHSEAVVNWTCSSVSIRGTCWNKSDINMSVSHLCGSNPTDTKQAWQQLKEEFQKCSLNRLGMISLQAIVMLLSTPCVIQHHLTSDIFK